MLKETRLAGLNLNPEMNEPFEPSIIQRDNVEQRHNFHEIKDRVRDIPVCLVIPDSDFLLDARVFPFIGILKIAAELERNGNPVFVIDLSKYRNQEEIIAEFVKSHPEVSNYGITATTPQIPAAVRLRNTIKEHSPQSKIILGGPHVTMTYTGTTEDKKAQREGRATAAFKRLEGLFERLVIGDGELAIFSAIDSQNPNKIIDAGNIKDDLFLKKGELGKFLPPARHMIDHDSYKFYIRDDKEKIYRAFSVIGQLGCPFECGFCCGRDSHVLRFPRTRDIASVIAEVEQVMIEGQKYKEPFSGVMFYDDELNAVKGNLEELCRGLIDLQERLGIEMRFRGFVKADLFTKEQAELMYKAGFRILLTGVESGSDRTLLAMKKRTSRLINSRCVEYAHAAGLRVKALMSVGHPGESRETIAESVEWVLANLKPGDEVDWTIITQYPGSPYYDHSVYVPEQDAWLYTTAIRYPNGNRETLSLWSKEIDFITESEFYKGIPGDYRAYVWTDSLDPNELVKERDNAESITRSALGLPPLEEQKGIQYEHSMGQGLPPKIMRKSGIVYTS